MVFQRFGANLNLVFYTNCWSLHLTNKPDYSASCCVYCLQQNCINIRMKTARTVLYESLAMRIEKITQVLVITDYGIFSAAEEIFLKYVYNHLQVL